MDPQFLERLNALQNYQNQQTNQATQAELAALREQLAEEANKPKCPHCGGPSEQGFDRCKNCSQEVIWCGHFVGKPGTMDQLEMAMEQYEISQQARWKWESDLRAIEGAKIKAKEKSQKNCCCLLWSILFAILAFPVIAYSLRLLID